MAPELRKRKVVAEAPKSNGTPVKAVAKTVAKGKRKAADDSSPVSLKKQKPVKKTTVKTTVEEPAEPAKVLKVTETTTTTTAPKATKATKAAKAKKPVDEEKVVDEEDFLAAPDSSDSEDEGHDAQALANQLDPEDDEGAGKSLFKPGQDVGKAPAASETLEKSKKTRGEPGVVYIGRIPHGFYEFEMKQYFSQFGPISRLRLSRNKKTGESKHFAFVEFAEASTAEIVAKTMDNYLLFGHILKCKTLPKDDVHDDLFKGANRRFKKIPWNSLAGKKLEKPMSESAWEAKVVRERNNRAKKAAKLKEIGYEFEASELKDVPAPGLVEDVEVEVKAIEAAPEAEAEAAAEVVVEEETISAPKTKTPKAKAAKATKTKKVKA